MPLHKLVKPRLPSAAIGIESNVASLVQLDRGRGGFVIRRAASLNLSPELIKPGFDQPNISDPVVLATVLTDLSTSAGLLRQRKFSACLPEATTFLQGIDLEIDIALSLSQLCLLSLPVLLGHVKGPMFRIYGVKC